MTGRTWSHSCFPTRKEVLSIMRKLIAIITLLLILPAAATFADCGKQRWDIKTTADPAAESINPQAVDTTIAQLANLRRPEKLKRTSARLGAEFDVFVVDATLVTYFSEADGDLHLVLADDDGVMIAEIPDPDCVPSDARFHDAIAETRAHFLHHFNGKRSKNVVNERIAIAGVGFFDAPHNVGMAAPNFIELHPVIAVKFAPHN